MAREITAEEKQIAAQMLARARAAISAVENYSQEQGDRLCRAVAWASGNEQAAVRPANMSVDESGMGSREPTRRARILGILRDALRQKSTGVIEEIPEKEIAKYAKPAGVIASLIPVTSACVTPAGVAIFTIKCRDAVIFSPHPASRKTTNAVVRMMRCALKKLGAPEDLLQCVEKSSIPLAQEIMAICDLTTATGGQAMVRAAVWGSRPTAWELVTRPWYRRNSEHRGGRPKYTHQQDQRLRLWLLRRWQSAGGSNNPPTLSRSASKGRRLCCCARREAPFAEGLLGRRGPPHGRHYRALRQIVAGKAGFAIPDGTTFLIVPEDKIGKQHLFSTEKLGIVLAIYKYTGFDTALEMVRQIFETGGKGHSCGIYSFSDDHIHRLALVAPVSRIMVRQPHPLRPTLPIMRPLQRRIPGGACSLASAGFSRNATRGSSSSHRAVS